MSPPTGRSSIEFRIGRAYRDYDLIILSVLNLRFVDLFKIHHVAINHYSVLFNFLFLKHEATIEEFSKKKVYGFMA